MMRLYVEGVGLCGPGLDGWGESAPVLAGERDYVPAPVRVPPAALLPANERRRAVQTVRLALAVGAEAFAAAGRDPSGTATVFASSGGDGENIHQILSVLASSTRELSPTRFHNSVHNTPAGYWSIATGSRAASSSLCCHDDSFAAGLLEAAVQASSAQQAVALVAYDVQYPAPLGDVRPIGAPFAVALVLAPEGTGTAIAGLELDLRPATDASDFGPPALEDLRRSTPAARSLPLLAALARKEAASLSLSYLGDMVLKLNVAPVRRDEPPSTAGSASGAS
jgi:Beta-ketoacyl synthase, N-terminal domain